MEHTVRYTFIGILHKQRGWEGGGIENKRDNLVDAQQYGRNIATAGRIVTNKIDVVPLHISFWNSYIAFHPRLLVH